MDDRSHSAGQSAAGAGAARIVPCLWFGGDALAAAEFYAATFPDSRVDRVIAAPGDSPGGKAGDVLTVEFTVLGSRFLGLNGGSPGQFNQSVSFQVFTDSQGETDRLWDAIVADGGEAGQCSWCKDRFGLWWQVVPRALMRALSAGGDSSKRVMAAMMTMRKIDIAAIEAAARG